MIHMVTVFDPHPGDSGCVEPLPESLRLVATSMSGQRLPLAEVVDRLRDAVPDGAFGVQKDHITYGRGRQIYVECAPHGLLLWQHNWLVLRIER